MQFHFSGGKPVYMQIVEQFRDAVLSGEYSPGERVPSVRELAAVACVNPNTMQRALSALEEEKLLICISTAGRYVTLDKAILDSLRKKAVDRIVKEYAEKLDGLGVSRAEAASLLLKEE